MSAKTEKPTVGTVLGALPSGLFVLACDGDYSVVSWVQQAGFSPPAISVALAHGRAVATSVLAGKPFTLSALPDGALAMCKPFLAGDAAGAKAALDEHGVVRGALGWLKCRHRAHTHSGDHDVIVAEVLDGARLLPHAKPYVHLRRDGSRY